MQRDRFHEMHGERERTDRQRRISKKLAAPVMLHQLTLAAIGIF
jgi:hypothetical protein